MKKILFATILSSLILTSCNSLKTKENIATPSEIKWKTAYELPAQFGFNENIGTAGLLYGVLDNDYIVAAGGANFPINSVLNGGPKVTHPDIYLLKENNGKLDLISHTKFPHEIAYGSSITTKDGIYYIGGAKDMDKNDDIWFISKNENKLDIKKIAELPFTFQNGKALLKDNKIYIIAGKQGGKTSNEFYSFDLTTHETQKLANLPGEPRAQEVAEILDGNIYVFGGGNSKAFTDGYKYDFATKEWSKVANVEINGRHISLLGGNSIKLNNDEMLVIGGFNKKVWDDANYYLSNLKGDELKAYKENYFNTDPKDFKWNDDILVYNAKTNKWKSLGKLPFNAPCGEGLILINNKIISINGEIKPGVRTNRIYVGDINF